ncbi:MAG TPA: hypothetical protein VF810_01110 [Patescibacteria group bacterium]
MQLRFIIIKLCVFISLFTLLFFGIRYLNLLRGAQLSENLNSIPWLFSAIAVIFSIISGFVIQTQWHTWDSLNDASHGELTMLRQLHNMAHHFPEKFQNDIRIAICRYLHHIIKESQWDYDRGVRSPFVEKALNQLEDLMFEIFKKFPTTGSLAFSFLNRGMEYREKRLQSSSHHLPPTLRFFIIFATFSMVFTSLFIVISSLLYYYLFTLIIGLLAYGIYLLIDDLDHPYRPGNWHLKTDTYKDLYLEIKEQIGYNEE